MTRDNLEEVFGEEIVESIQDKQENGETPTDDEKLYLLIASLHNNIDKSVSEVLEVLATMDAEKDPDVFEAFEDSLKHLKTILEFLETDHVKEVQYRDYDLDEK